MKAPFQLLAASTSAAGTSSPSPGGSRIGRKDLLTAELSPGKLISRVEIKEVTLAPMQEVPLHLHPCPVVGVLMEGKIAFQIEGAEVSHLHAGDAFYEPPNVRIARFDNEGESPARFVAFYLLGDEDKDIIRMITA